MAKAKSLVVIMAVVASGAIAPGAMAKDVQLFFEDFEGVTGPFFGTTPTARGLPLESDGAKEKWFGGTFENPDNGTLDQDLAVQIVDVAGNPSKVASADDDRGFLFKISTTGLKDVMLMFDWRNFEGAASDQFVASYFVGEIAGLSDADRFEDLQVMQANGDFVQLMQDHSASWQSAMFNLPEDTAVIYVALWSDSRDGDFVQFDNVKVDANYIMTPIPLPAAAWMGLTLLGGLGVTKKLRRLVV